MLSKTLNHCFSTSRATLYAFLQVKIIDNCLTNNPHRNVNKRYVTVLLECIQLNLKSVVKFIQTQNLNFLCLQLLTQEQVFKNLGTTLSDILLSHSKDKQKLGNFFHTVKLGDYFFFYLGLLSTVCILSDSMFSNGYDCLCSKADTQMCSVKKMFLEISINSQENTCARVYFLVKLQA